jgi:hypothetical protein
MNHVRIDEFQRRVGQFLSAHRAVAIDKDDRTIGLYLPVPSANDEEFRQTMSRLETTIQRVLDRTGMTEDELADLFNPNVPLSAEVESEASAFGASDR